MLTPSSRPSVELGLAALVVVQSAAVTPTSSALLLVLSLPLLHIVALQFSPCQAWLEHCLLTELHLLVQSAKTVQVQFSVDSITDSVIGN